MVFSLFFQRIFDGIWDTFGSHSGLKWHPGSPKWLQTAFKLSSVIVPLGVSPSKLALGRLGDRFWIYFGWIGAPVQRATGPTCNVQRSIFNVQRSVFDAQDFVRLWKAFGKILGTCWESKSHTTIQNAPLGIFHGGILL